MASGGTGARMTHPAAPPSTLTDHLVISSRITEERRVQSMRESLPLQVELVLAATSAWAAPLLGSRSTQSA